MPSAAIAAMLLAVFGLVCFAARGLVLRRCDEEAREELADQAKSLLTGVAATFAFFVGFAISIGWGAVSAAQGAVEQQATAIQQMAWELRNMPDQSQSRSLLDKLTAYAQTAADQDPQLLAQGVTIGLPSAAPLEAFETALYSYTDKQPEDRATARMTTALTTLVSSSAAVASVANRALPQPLAALLFLVGVLVSAAMGISTVTYGRRSMIFVGVWCLVPALSLTVVLALAYPFALRTGLTVAPLRAVAQHLVPA